MLVFPLNFFSFIFICHNKIKEFIIKHTHNDNIGTIMLSLTCLTSVAKEHTENGIEEGETMIFQSEIENQLQVSLLWRPIWENSRVVLLTGLENPCDSSCSWFMTLTCIEETKIAAFVISWLWAAGKTDNAVIGNQRRRKQKKKIVNETPEKRN